MVKFIVGDYNPTKDDIVIENFSQCAIQRSRKTQDKNIILFVEYLNLSTKDCADIAKESTANVIVVMNNPKYIKGLRKSKKVSIEYRNNEIINVFDVAKAVVTIKDRDYVYGFLKTNKPPMYMLVKALIGAYDKLDVKNSKKLKSYNKNVVAWLDMHQWKVNPLILYAVMAFKFKPQVGLGWIGWKFPKKKK